MASSSVADSAIYSSQYSEVSEYDVDVLGVGVKKYFSLGNKLRFSLGVRTDQSYIDGNDYLQSVYYYLGTRYKLRKSDSLRLSIRLQDSDNGNDIYYGLAGKSLRFSADYSNYVGLQRWRLRYRFDQDDKQQLAELYPDSPMARALPASQNLKFVDDRPAHDRRYGISTERLRKELGFSPDLNFARQMQHTVGWYLLNPSWWRHMSAKLTAE